MHLEHVKQTGFDRYNTHDQDAWLKHLGLAHEDGKELFEASEVHPALTGGRAARGGKVQHL